MEEDVPVPIYVALDFVCFDKTGFGCASKGAWNAQGNPVKHPEEAPWINPFHFYTSGQGHGLNMVDTSEDDAMFCARVLNHTCRIQRRKRGAGHIVALKGLITHDALRAT